MANDLQQVQHLKLKALELDNALRNFLTWVSGAVPETLGDLQKEREFPLCLGLCAQVGQAARNVASSVSPEYRSDILDCSRSSVDIAQALRAMVSDPISENIMRCYAHLDLLQVQVAYVLEQVRAAAQAVAKRGKAPTVTPPVTSRVQRRKSTIKKTIDMLGAEQAFELYGEEIWDV